ncbi:MAG TPA: DUF3618 domain-containing protein [Mycobacterium sp.]|nr:DUF3618 domain-containing protein [Mycobacterium sp.]
MATPEHLPPELPPDAGIDDIQADIRRTRHELGQTVEALSSKLNVKEQARYKAAELRSKTPPVVPVAILAAVVAVVGLVIWRRRSSHDT